MIRNIIFDWSGTLVDDLPAVLAATNFVFEQCGVEALTLEKFRAESRRYPMLASFWFFAASAACAHLC